MALGGGTWLFQNKVLPGAYINFKSKYRPNTEMVDRGYGAMAIPLDWGPVDTVFTVEAEDFQNKSTAIFGYDYTDPRMKGLRDLFKNLKTGYFYRLSNGAVKAECSLARAKYAGSRGNDITIAVEADPDAEGQFIVFTYLDIEGVPTLMHRQSVAEKSELEDNDYVDFIDDGEDLEASAGLRLAGGNNGERKAYCSLATAKNTGIEGNSLSIAVSENDDEDGSYTVETHLDTDGEDSVVDTQTVASKDELESNDYVDFIDDGAPLAEGNFELTGGSGGEITALQHQNFLSVIDSYYFNTIGVVTTDNTLKGLYEEFTRRLRDDVGMKFQLVVYNSNSPDYEGVINIKNRATDSGESPASLVWWVMGAEASCPVNASCTNKIYDGEYTVDAKYGQTELKNSINEGYLTFHRVTDPASGDIEGDIRILTDINSFTSFTKTKNKEFAKNQVIRVLDQIAIDVSRLFNRFYLGVEPNDYDGRSAFWNDLVAYYKELQRVRAIQNFVEEDLPMPVQGDDKDTVLTEHTVQPTCAMEKLYMTVIVA